MLCTVRARMRDSKIGFSNPCLQLVSAVPVNIVLPLSKAVTNRTCSRRHASAV